MLLRKRGGEAENGRISVEAKNPVNERLRNRLRLDWWLAPPRKTSKTQGLEVA